MTKQLFKGRLFGHPIHPMLVHFPTALFTVSFLFDGAGLWLDEIQLVFASFYCLFLGLIGGIGAGVFGFIDYIKLAKGNEQVFVKASWHAGIQFCMFSGFGVLFGIRMQAYPDLSFLTMSELALSGSLVLLMFIGNYLGGDLVFRHGVGMEPKGR